MKDEMHTRTILQARIHSDSSESEKFEEEAREKTGKVALHIYVIFIITFYIVGNMNFVVSQYIARAHHTVNQYFTFFNIPFAI